MSVWGILWKLFKEKIRTRLYLLSIPQSGEKNVKKFRWEFITPARTTTRTYSKMSTGRCIDCRRSRQLMAAWTKGVTAELCDGHQKMNCATEKYAPT